MAASTEPNRLKVPGESTTNPSFAAPQIQTAPDVRVSQNVAGIPSTAPSATPNDSQTGQGNTPAPASPTVTPSPSSGGAETTNYSPEAQIPTSQPTVPTSTGAPPGVPQTTPVVAAPPMPAPPKAMEGKNQAESEYLQSKSQYQQKLYEAALGYNAGPTSSLAKNQLRAGENTRVATANRGAAGTINSSLFAGDKGRIATDEATRDTEAFNTYTHALAEANDFMTKAENAWQGAQERAAREAAEAKARQANEQPKYVPQAPNSIVGGGTPIPGVPNPQAPPGPAPPGKEWTPSGGGGWVPIGTRVVRTY